MMTLHPRAQAQAGSGLGLKRPERRRCRSRLRFCHRINEEDDALGMLQTASLPPSKPIAPGECVVCPGERPRVNSWRNRLIKRQFRLPKDPQDFPWPGARGKVSVLRNQDTGGDCTHFFASGRSLPDLRTGGRAGAVATASAARHFSTRRSLPCPLARCHSWPPLPMDLLVPARSAGRNARGRDRERDGMEREQRLGHAS